MICCLFQKRRPLLFMVLTVPDRANSLEIWHASQWNKFPNVLRPIYSNRLQRWELRDLGNAAHPVEPYELQVLQSSESVQAI